MITFNERQRKILNAAGRGARGKELIELFQNIRNDADSTSSIPKGTDVAAEVAGRQMLCKLFDDILENMTKPLLPADSNRKREGEDDYT